VLHLLYSQLQEKEHFHNSKITSNEPLPCNIHPNKQMPLKRTPPKIQKGIEDFFTPNATTPHTARDLLNAKRSRLNLEIEDRETDEVSMEDNLKKILDAVSTSNQDLSAKFAKVQDNVDITNTKIDVTSSKIDGLVEQIATVSADVEAVSTTVFQHGRDLNILKRQVNDLEQAKLGSHMEVTGLSKSDLEQNKNDLVSFALQTITSFNIPLTRDKIKDAFVRTVDKINLSVLIVIFKDIGDKSMVMKAKRSSNDTRKIYFDHLMTSYNRAMYQKARAIAKSRGLKIGFNGSRVMCTKPDQSKIRISWFDDFSQLEAIPESTKNPAAAAATGSQQNKQA
jgi:hypothetical protein